MRGLLCGVARLGASDAALRAFAEDKVGWPLGAGVGLRSLVAADEIFQSIETGVEHLGAERALDAAPDHEHGGAMHQRPQREHETSVLAGRATEALSDALAHEIERGPGLVQRRGLREAVEEHFESVRMLNGEMEVAFAGLGERTGGAHGVEEIAASLQAHAAEKVLAVTVALVDRRGGGARGAGYGAHGEGFGSAASPQPAGDFEDALFEFRIRMPGQRLVSSASTSFREFLRLPPSLPDVKLTMYNKCTQTT
jgi:hypothetical protein